LYLGNDNDTAAIDAFTKNYVEQLSSLVENVFSPPYAVDAYEIGNELNQFENGCGDGIERLVLSYNDKRGIIANTSLYKVSCES